MKALKRNVKRERKNAKIHFRCPQKCNKTEMSEKGWSQSLCPYFVVFTHRCHLKRRQKYEYDAE